MLRKPEKPKMPNRRNQTAKISNEFRSLIGLDIAKIDWWLLKQVDYIRLDQFIPHATNIPSYRFYDLFHAVNRFAELSDGQFIDSSYADSLQTLLKQTTDSRGDRKIRKPRQRAFSVGYQKDEFLPTDRFWAVPPTAEHPATIIQLKVDEYHDNATLEVASTNEKHAQNVLESIMEDSKDRSIYRGELVQISFDSKVDERYGHVIQNNCLKLNFMLHNPVTDKDIIIDPEIRSILQRNLFDFHAKRELLRNVGLPNKKGLLFYGPPGTGKTFTCKYIYSNLPGVTCLVVSGKSLTQIKTVCSVAKMLQPALIVLEDVDLVFTTREINLYSSVLGDMLDEMDGFESDDAVTFLLTTNAIERLEQAIKDRPGRISQCVFFGPPDADLRELYLQRYLQDFDTSELDLDEVVALTGGTTQAYLKELVNRSVQVALEDASVDLGDVDKAKMILKNCDFEIAHNEMTSGKNESAASIIGFG